MRLGVVVLLLVGCAGTPAVAERWAREDLSCQDAQASWVDHDIFEVQGCGTQALYLCPNRTACERIDGPDGVAAEDAHADASVRHPERPEGAGSLATPSR